LVDVAYYDRYYNKTEFSGLETHIANSYANPLLQLIRFIPVLRNCALHHAATVCVLDTCLLCELGFLFDMLEAAGGLNCQATNFLKTLSSLSHASSLGLLDEDSPNGPLSPRIQNMTRFLLDTIWIDYSKISINVGYIDGLMTTKGNTYIRCMYCQTRTMRASNSHSIDLQYPRKQRAKPRSSGKHDPKSEWANFSEVLKGSIEAAGQTRGWCEKCKSYKLLETQKRIDGIPEILMINTALHSEESKQYWATPGWLPERIGITPKEGAVYCFQGAELERHAQDPRFDAKIWELVGVVADIKDGAIQTSHLVSLVDGKTTYYMLDLILISNSELVISN
jgi:PAB-dependent poly(A)-specific ribonuclease subunit 2